MPLLVLPALAQQSTLKNELIGSWQLLSATDNYTGGHSANNWGKLRGMLTFDSAGNFAQVLIGDPNPQMKTPDPRKPDAPAVAYFGKYTVENDSKNDITQDYECDVLFA
ncbi:MAG TPA: hypothetical protein VJ728_04860 [Candidatus Binataceae bacterium]|nr:hypothetical protein [Candidatus Binataceae bacterium]